MAELGQEHHGLHETIEGEATERVRASKETREKMAQNFEAAKADAHPLEGERNKHILAYLRDEDSDPSGISPEVVKAIDAVAVFLDELDKSPVKDKELTVCETTQPWSSPAKEEGVATLSRSDYGIIIALLDPGTSTGTRDRNLRKDQMGPEGATGKIEAPDYIVSTSYWDKPYGTSQSRLSIYGRDSELGRAELR